MNVRIVNLINAHNNVVKGIKNTNITINGNDLLNAMSISHSLVTVGDELTRIAREEGINAKCNMQSGEITIY